MEINIKVNETQAGIIKQALDFYSRFLMGQFERIDDLMMWKSNYSKDQQKSERLNALISEMRDIIYPELNGYAHWGIFNPKCPEESKVAYDVIQVLRHELWKLDPDKRYSTVDAGRPIQSSEEELCRVDIVVEDVI